MTKFVKYNFKGKVALITGAASGLGLATAKSFADAGASVVLADYREDAVQEAAKELTDQGLRALAVCCDVTKEEQVRTMIEKTVSKFGHLDIAYNNAGIISSIIQTADIKSEDWNRMQSVNLNGIWLCMKHELQEMLKQGAGVIVNCSSMGGLKGVPGLSGYGASKHAVIGLTKSAALEYIKQGIRINAVCPGMVHTPMEEVLTGGNADMLAEMVKVVPAGRFIEPEEIAAAVLWLCSPDSSMVIGQAIAIDGGITV